MIGSAASALLSMDPGSSLPTSGNNMSSEQVDKVAKDFESMFMSQMLDQMFGDTSGTEAFGDSETGDIYKSLMMDEYGKQISKAGGIGIADYVKRELLKEQEIK